MVVQRSIVSWTKRKQSSIPAASKAAAGRGATISQSGKTSSSRRESPSRQRPRSPVSKIASRPVERGHADYGVVPIENSTDGTITDTLDAFSATEIKIVAELTLRIRHHLCAAGPRESLRRVYSRHTVFGQCRRWLAGNMPGIELIECVSTTKAAERGSDLAAGPSGRP